MDKLESNFLNYIETSIAHFTATSKKLQEQEKVDEANLEKIKKNVYDIFKTLFNVDKKRIFEKTKDYDLFCLEYLKRFDTIPQSWKISLDNATKHGDTVNQVIEELKLNTALNIKNEFLKLSKQ